MTAAAREHGQRVFRESPGVCFYVRADQSCVRLVAGEPVPEFAPEGNLGVSIPGLQPPAIVPPDAGAGDRQSDALAEAIATALAVLALLVLVVGVRVGRS